MKKCKQILASNTALWACQLLGACSAYIDVALLWLMKTLTRKMIEVSRYTDKMKVIGAHSDHAQFAAKAAIHNGN